MLSNCLHIEISLRQATSENVLKDGPYSHNHFRTIVAGDTTCITYEIKFNKISLFNAGYIGRKAFFFN